VDDPARAEFFERESVEQMSDDRQGNEGYRDVFDAEYRVLGENPTGPPITGKIPPRPNSRRINYIPPLILFLITVGSTFFSQGWQYALPVMSVLVFHEFGHYLQCRRYGVPSTLPYFIPMPMSPFGTMGAVIVQKSEVANRKELFDIAISGPLAGLLVAIPVLIWGLSDTTLKSPPESYAEITSINDLIRFRNPLLIQWFISWKFGEVPPGFEISMYPVAFAGWVGIFITALNLIPIGQLDGGHMLYCLLGKPARVISLWLWWGAVGWILFNSWRGNGDLEIWLLMLALLGMMGVRHPPTANDNVPLGPVRTILGWITLPFIFIGFTPNPITIEEIRFVWDMVTRSLGWA